jgi:hypothetical protein
MLQTAIEFFKNLIDLTPEKKNYLLITSFSALICIYLYDKSIKLEEKLNNSEVKCSELVSKIHSDCNDDINKTRNETQNQLNEFIKVRNVEYSELTSKITIYEQKFKRLNKDFNNLKNEELDNN